jgi:hypothetical protein
MKLKKISDEHIRAIAEIIAISSPILEKHPEVDKQIIYTVAASAMATLRDMVRMEDQKFWEMVESVVAERKRIGASASSTDPIIIEK